jgi:outer membrane protein TolC
VTLTKDQIRYKAAEIYLQSLTSHEQTSLLAQKVDALRKEADVVLAEFPYHLVSEDQVKSAKLQLQQAEIMLHQSEWLAVNAFENVVTLLGVDDPRLVRINTIYPEMSITPNYQGLITKVLQSHPNLAIQQANLDKAKAQQALTFSAFFPTANIVGSYAWGNDYDPPGQDQWLAVLQVTLPIFDFGANYYAERAASTDVEAQKKRLLEVKEALEQTIHDDFMAVESAQSAYSSSEVDLSAKDLAYQRLLVLSGVGQAAVLDLLQAQTAYLDSYSAEEAAHYQVLLSCATLEKDSSRAWKCAWSTPAKPAHTLIPAPTLAPPSTPTP